MSSRYLQGPSAYKNASTVLYLVRWINDANYMASKKYLRKAAALRYFENRIAFTDSPCWIETFNIISVGDSSFGDHIPTTYSEAVGYDK